MKTFVSFVLFTLYFFCPANGFYVDLESDGPATPFPEFASHELGFSFRIRLKNHNFTLYYPDKRGSRDDNIALCKKTGGELVTLLIADDLDFLHKILPHQSQIYLSDKGQLEWPLREGFDHCQGNNCEDLLDVDTKTLMKVSKDFKEGDKLCMIYDSEEDEESIGSNKELKAMIKALSDTVEKLLKGQQDTKKILESIAKKVQAN